VGSRASDEAIQPRRRVAPAHKNLGVPGCLLQGCCSAARREWLAWIRRSSDSAVAGRRSAKDEQLSMHAAAGRRAGEYPVTSMPVWATLATWGASGSQPTQPTQPHSGDRLDLPSGVHVMQLPSNPGMSMQFIQSSFSMFRIVLVS
jgi:hypothetical protein